MAQRQRRHGLVESPMARAASQSEDLGVVPTRAGRSPGLAISPGTVKTAFCGATTNGNTALWNPNGSGGFIGQDLGVVRRELADRRNRRFHRDRQDRDFVAQRPTATRLVESQRLGRLHRRGSRRRSTSWQIAGTGDFSGNGKSGILWRNDQWRHGVVESQWLGRLHCRGSGRRRHELVCAQNFRLRWRHQAQATWPRQLAARAPTIRLDGRRQLKSMAATPALEGWFRMEGIVAVGSGSCG